MRSLAPPPCRGAWVKYLLLLALPIASTYPNGSPLCDMDPNDLAATPHHFVSTPSTFKLNFTFQPTSGLFEVILTTPQTFIGLHLSVLKNSAGVGNWISPTSAKYAANTYCPSFMTHRNPNAVPAGNVTFSWQPTNDLQAGDLLQPSVWVALDQRRFVAVSASPYTVTASVTETITAAPAPAQTGPTNSQRVTLLMGLFSVLFLHGSLSGFEWFLERGKQHKHTTSYTTPVTKDSRLPKPLPMIPLRSTRIGERTASHQALTGTFSSSRMDLASAYSLSPA